ncbi:hypothetical protein V7S43_016157 [Phytophthora oleae]|uniref:Uncharacterized protein n=1 Tax=Phytophthora oleae TaxID=2107226 RepID=A0ABD3F0V9_9STRA
MDIQLLLSDWDDVVHDSLQNDDCVEGSDEGYGELGDDGGAGVAAELAVDEVTAGQEYLDTQKREGGITLLQEERVRRAYRTTGFLGLFALFFSCKVRNTLLLWLNPRL